MMTDTEDAARHKAKMEKRKAVQDAEVASKTLEKGLLIVNTGPGKGKSTAAFGLILRALGHGWRIGVVQFIKGAWSTGERKALLVCLILSHARLVTQMHGFAPVVLLDDVAAFLDAERRAALFAALRELGAQVFVSGVDEGAFETFDETARRFRVTPGTISRLS